MAGKSSRQPLRAEPVSAAWLENQLKSRRSKSARHILKASQWPALITSHTSTLGFAAAIRSECRSGITLSSVP